MTAIYQQNREPDAQKVRIRAEMRTIRTELTPQGRAAASLAVSNVLITRPELQGGGPFLLYAALGDELNVDAVVHALLERGAMVCLPRVDGDRLALHPTRSLAGLQPGWRGVREPAADAGEISAELLQALVVPGLAFDAQGNRLGYGGGHFDRLLARVPAHVPVIGVAFDAQVLAAVPADAQDQPVHVVITESRTIETR